MDGSDGERPRPCGRPGRRASRPAGRRTGSGGRSSPSVACSPACTSPGRSRTRTPRPSACGRGAAGRTARAARRGRRRAGRAARGRPATAPRTPSTTAGSPASPTSSGSTGHAGPRARAMPRAPSRRSVAQAQRLRRSGRPGRRDRSARRGPTAGGAPCPGSRDLAPLDEEVEHHPHVLVVVPAARRPRLHAGVGQLAQRQRPVGPQQLEDVATAGVVGGDPVALRTASSCATAPVPGHSAISAR